MVSILFRTSLFAGLLLLAGCRMAPVHNVESVPLYAPSNATLEAVTGAIKQAGIGLGWQMNEKAPGSITGKLALRTHVAVVDIKYDTKVFSITYADSVNLRYNGTNIHNNYNSWVLNLKNAIVSQASGI